MTDSLAKFQSEDQLIKALSDILCVYLFLAVCPQIKLPLSTRQFGGHASCVCNICLESWVTSPLFTTLVYKVGSSFRCLQHFFLQSWIKLPLFATLHYKVGSCYLCNTCLQSWVMLPLFATLVYYCWHPVFTLLCWCVCYWSVSVYIVLLVYEACVLLACQCSLSYWCMKHVCCWPVSVHCPTGVWSVCWPVTLSLFTILLVLCCWPVSVHSPPGVCVVGLSVFTVLLVCVLLACVHTVLLVCVCVLLACQCSHCPTGVCCWPGVHTVILMRVVGLSVFSQTGVCVGLSVFTLSYWCTCYWPACSHCPTGVCVCWPVGVHTALLVCECVVGLLMFTLSYWCVWCSPVSVHTVLLVCVFVVVGLSVFTLSYWCVNVLLACQCSHTVLLMCMCWHCPSGVLACWCSHCPTGVWMCCWPVGVHTVLLVCVVFTCQCSHCPTGVSVLLAFQCSHCPTGV